MVLQEAGQVPRGPQLGYVRSKLKLLLYFTNMAAYLMFRAQGVSLTLHPAIGRPVHYRCCSDVRVHYRCTHRVFLDALASLVLMIDTDNSPIGN